MANIEQRLTIIERIFDSLSQKLWVLQSKNQTNRNLNQSQSQLRPVIQQAVPYGRPNDRFSNPRKIIQEPLRQTSSLAQLQQQRQPSSFPKPSPLIQPETVRQPQLVPQLIPECEHQPASIIQSEPVNQPSPSRPPLSLFSSHHKFAPLGQSAHFRNPAHQSQHARFPQPAPFQPAPAPIFNQRGWQIWSCCTFWFGFLSLLAGIGLIIPTIISLINTSGCGEGYNHISDKCCNATTCQQVYSSNGFIRLMILISIGIVCIFVGICFLRKSNRFYRDNNNEAFF